MINRDQWQRMTPKQQWDAFNALQNEQARERKQSVVEQAELPSKSPRTRVAEQVEDVPADTSL